MSGGMNDPGPRPADEYVVSDEFGGENFAPAGFAVRSPLSVAMKALARIEAVALEHGDQAYYAMARDAQQAVQDAGGTS